MFVAGYGHFLRTAAASQWDEAAVDLSADARAWPELEPALRERLTRLVGGFCVAEGAVASEIAPFAQAASDVDLAACFDAQAIDERRHARFFDRVAVEVLGLDGDSTDARLDLARSLGEPAFLELFEERLPDTARALGAGAGARSLPRAVALYHLLLEGIVFTAGQLALQRLLEGAEPELPGLRRGVELVLRDERWHVGLGARVLDDLVADPRPAEALLAEAAAAVASWGDVVGPDLAERVLALHRRRLAAARLVPSSTAVARGRALAAAAPPASAGEKAQTASCNSSGPPRTPLATATS